MGSWVNVPPGFTTTATTQRERAIDAVVEHRIAEGRRWEDTVVAALLEGTQPTIVTEPRSPIDPGAPTVIDRRVHRHDRETITLEAMRAGAPLILGGRMSAESLQSVGVPDILVRLDDGYAPIDVKHHKAIGQSGIPVRITSLDRLEDTDGRTGYSEAIVSAICFRSPITGSSSTISGSRTLATSAGSSAPRRR